MVYFYTIAWKSRVIFSLSIPDEAPRFQVKRSKRCQYHKESESSRKRYSCVSDGIAYPVPEHCFGEAVAEGDTGCGEADGSEADVCKLGNVPR